MTDLGNRSSAVKAQRHEPSEVWLPIKAWPGYEVSNLGRVRSFKWPTKERRWVEDRSRGARILKTSPRNRYPSIVLSDVKLGRKTKNIHELVLEVFVGPRPMGCQAAHNDGDRLNNRVSNLRWATPSENNADKKQHGTHQEGEAIGTSKLTTDEVAEIRRLRASGTKARLLAERFGVCRNTITNITQGHYWKDTLIGKDLSPAQEEKA